MTMPGPSETSVELTVRITVPSDLAAFLQTGEPHVADLVEVLSAIGTALVRRHAGGHAEDALYGHDMGPTRVAAVAAESLLRQVEARR